MVVITSIATATCRCRRAPGLHSYLLRDKDARLIIIGRKSAVRQPMQRREQHLHLHHVLPEADNRIASSDAPSRSRNIVSDYRRSSICGRVAEETVLIKSPGITDFCSKSSSTASNRRRGRATGAGAQRPSAGVRISVGTLISMSV